MAGESAEFEFTASEIKEQPYIQVIGFQIVQTLGDMDIFKLCQRFYLDHNRILNEKINPTGSDVYSFIEKRDFLFPDKLQALPLHFQSQTPLVNHFLESVTEDSVYFHCAADYTGSDIGVFVFGFDGIGIHNKACREGFLS